MDETVLGIQTFFHGVDQPVVFVDFGLQEPIPGTGKNPVGIIAIEE